MLLQSRYSLTILCSGVTVMLGVFRTLLVVLCGVYVSVAYAADPDFNSYRDKGAVRGYDVVAYFSLPEGAKAVKGKKEYAVIWNDVPWYFSTEQNLQKFKKSPEAYAPAYGGYCAFAASKNFTTSIRPNSWIVHEGKLYLNHNSASRRLFFKDIETGVAEADSNWPELLKRCEKRGNCRRLPKLPSGVDVLVSPNSQENLNHP